MSAAANDFDLQGHRGARGLMPENTLPGFAHALAIGVTTIELDLAVTGDGVVVASHNPRLEPELARDAEGRWLQQSSAPIYSMTLKQVKSYDVGRLNPRLKYAARFARQQGLDGRVTIQSFDWRALQEVQRIDPDIVTSYLSVDQRWLSNLQTRIPGPSPWLAGLDIDDFDGSAPRAIKAAGGDIWSPYHREVDADAIKLAHDLGLQVSVWTVNNKERMRELIAMGVDGIITDYPDRLRELLGELRIRVAKPTPVNLQTRN